MLELPAPQDGDAERDVIFLHNDPTDFEHFLWFIHAESVDCIFWRSLPAWALTLHV